MLLTNMLFRKVNKELRFTVRFIPTNFGVSINNVFTFGGSSRVVSGGGVMCIRGMAMRAAVKKVHFAGFKGSDSLTRIENYNKQHFSGLVGSEVALTKKQTNGLRFNRSNWFTDTHTNNVSVGSRSIATATFVSSKSELSMKGPLKLTKTEQNHYLIYDFASRVYMICTTMKPGKFTTLDGKPITWVANNLLFDNSIGKVGYAQGICKLGLIGDMALKETLRVMDANDRQLPRVFVPTEEQLVAIRNMVGTFKTDLLRNDGRLLKYFPMLPTDGHSGYKAPRDLGLVFDTKLDLSTNGVLSSTSNNEVYNEVLRHLGETSSGTP